MSAVDDIGALAPGVKIVKDGIFRHRTNGKQRVRWNSVHCLDYLTREHGVAQGSLRLDRLFSSWFTMVNFAQPCTRALALMLVWTPTRKQFSVKN